MKKINNVLKKISLLLYSYIYKNRLFLSYVILSFAGCLFLRGFTIGNALNFKSMITELGLIFIIGSFGYFCKPDKQFRYFFSWLCIFTLIFVVNSIYYTFYTNFASVGELATLSQAETVTDSIFDGLKLVDFIYLFIPITFCYIHQKLRYSPYYNYMLKIEKSLKLFLFTMGIGIAIIVLRLIVSTPSDFSRLAKLWNRESVVERFGILLYQGNDIFQTLIPKINSLFGYEEAYELFTNYFESEEREKYNKENKYTGILEGYNVVYVHMESIQNFLMDLEFNGQTVTPNLNKLASEGLFFSNFYPQISTGTSSDAEYIMLTGLMPSSSGTVFVSYYDNTFNTIATNLKNKGYYTFSMHGNYSSMWNRNNVHPRLGYSEMYYRESFVFDTEKDWIGLGVNDKVFFEQAIEKLETFESTYENYFGTVITLSNHSPFDSHESFDLDLTDYYTDEVTGFDVSNCYLCDRDIGRYIVSSHYADEALGDFLTYIKESDYFNNTVFIFYGDHDAKISYKDMNYLYNYDYTTGKLKDKEDESYIEYDSYDHNLNKKTPLIIWTKNKTLSKKLKGEVDTTMGMYDAAPTLYNMLDIDNKYVLGHDIFNIQNNNIVVFPNGNYLTDTIYYNNSTGEYKILKEGIILDNDYITDNVEYTETLLGVNNAIITYDLFNMKKRDATLE
ncbi:MAG: hypothetical protein E7161_01640 [Firmicutes bacterium]|nr:hypothetical protein [Bacillota bacterium]